MATVEIFEPTGSLAHQASSCQKVLQKLSDESEQDEHEPNEWVGRQMAEFNLWCAKLGVNDEGHRSIDFRLKDVPETCEAIGLMLQSLQLDLNRLPAAAATAAAVVPSTKPQGPVPQNSTAVKSGGSDSDDGGSSDTSSLSFQCLSSPEGSTDDEETSVAALRKHVEDTLDRLHGLARQVQNAGAKDRRERIGHYRSKKGPSQVYNLLRRLALEKLQQGVKLPRASDAIKERIAESFARRRTRFAYLKARQTRRAVRPPADPSPEPVAAGPPNQEIDKRGHAGPAPAPHLAGGGAAAPAQDLAARPADGETLYTRTQNTKLQDTPEIRRIDRPESVASVTLRHTGFPKPPDVAGKIGFECPYCRLQFPAREADIGRWRYVKARPRLIGTETLNANCETK